MFSIVLKLICITIGGALGATSRFAIAEVLFTKTRLSGWHAILIVNVIGSFVIGMVFSALTKEMLYVTIHDELLPSLFVISDFTMQMVLALLATGFCGGFTTFSSFSLDTVLLFQQGSKTMAFINIVTSLAATVLAVIFGIFVGSQII